jgi:hypothetical protein
MIVIRVYSQPISARKIWIQILNAENEIRKLSEWSTTQILRIHFFRIQNLDSNFASGNWLRIHSIDHMVMPAVAVQTRFCASSPCVYRIV